MARAAVEPKEITMNLRLDSALKAEFMAATSAEDKPAAEVLRRLMQEYVREARRKAFFADAERQSLLISASEAGRREEAEAMRWVENASDALPAEEHNSDDEWFVSSPDPAEAR